MGVPAQPEKLLEMLTLCRRFAAPICGAAHKGTSSITRCSAQRRCTLLSYGGVKWRACAADKCTPGAIISSRACHLQGAANKKGGNNNKHSSTNLSWHWSQVGARKAVHTEFALELSRAGACIQRASQRLKLWLTGHQPHPVRLLESVVVVGCRQPLLAWPSGAQRSGCAPVPLKLHRGVETAAARGDQ